MEVSDNLLKEILQKNPSRTTLVLILKQMRHEGLFEELIIECSKGLDSFPEDIEIRGMLAEALLTTDRSREAEEELTRIATLIDDSASTYMNLAKIHIAQQRIDEASRLLRTYLAHRPDDTEASELLASICPDMVKDPMSPVLDMDEDQEEETIGLPDIATPTLAELYASQGQTQEAVDTYERVVEENPADSRSSDRLDELRSSLEAEGEATEEIAIKGQADQGAATDSSRGKKERMISVLESWLGSIKEQSGSPASAL